MMDLFSSIGEGKGKLDTGYSQQEGVLPIICWKFIQYFSACISFRVHFLSIIPNKSAKN